MSESLDKSAPSEGDPNESKLRQLFIAAKSLPGEQQEAFLKQECSHAPELLEEVRRLLEPDGAHRSLDDLQAMLAGSRGSVDLNEVAERLLASQDLEQIRPEIENYDLVEMVGEGGMGVVYRAVQQAPVQREVAVKVMKPGMDSLQLRKRFLREQAALASLSHPNIARLYDAGLTKSGQAFFTMEFVEGQAIDVFCSEKKCSLKELLNLFLQIIDAVHWANDNGFVHRDLKPSNIIVNEKKGVATACVIDFGVAKALSNGSSKQTQFTQIAQMIGTPLYMSPEQVEHSIEQIDQRTDVYALGTLLYQLLTGDTPLEKQLGEEIKDLSLFALRPYILTIEPKRPSHFMNGVRIPNDLDRVVLKAIERDRNCRYPSVADFGSDLRAFLQGEPISARPRSKLYNARKWLARNKTVVLGTLSVLLAGILIGAAFSVPPNDPDRQSPPQVASTTEQVKATVMLGAKEVSREVAELTEASQLSQMLEAFAKQRWDQLKSIELPREHHGGFLGTEPNQTQTDNLSLREFLFQIGNPQPVWTLPHPASVAALSYSKQLDLLATGCDDGTLRIWDVNQQSLSLEETEHGFELTAVAFSPDGKLLASGDREGQVCIWETENWKLRKKTRKRDGGIQSIAWSSSGDRFAIGVRYDELAVLDAEGKEIYSRSTPSSIRYESLEFLPDSPNLVVPQLPFRFQTFDTDAKKEVGSIAVDLLAQTPRAFTLVGEKRDAILASFSSATPTRIVHASFADGGILGTPVFDGNHFQSLSECPNQRWVVASTSDGWASLMDQAATPPLTMATLSLAKNQESITTVQWLNGKHVLSAASNGNVSAWKLNEIHPMHLVKKGEGEPISQMGPYLLTYGADNSSDASNPAHYLEVIDLRRVATDQVKNPIRIPAAIGTYFQAGNSIAVDPQHEEMVVAQQQNLLFYDLKSGRKISEAKLPTNTAESGRLSDIKRLTWSANGERLGILVGNSQLKKSSDASQAVLLFQRSEKDSDPLDFVTRIPVGSICSHIELSHKGHFFWVLLRENFELTRFEVETGARQKLHANSSSAEISLSQDDSLLVLNRPSLQIIDANHGKLIMQLGSGTRGACKFSDQNRLVWAHLSNYETEIWHLPEQRCLGTLPPSDLDGVVLFPDAKVHGAVFDFR